MIDERYSRNIGAITEEEQNILSGKHIFIAGCGGLGGYLLSNFLRMGVGHITIIDGDRFEESNLNRQLLSSDYTIGQYKSDAALSYAASVNSGVCIDAQHFFLSAENCVQLIKGADLILDALDNIESRRILAMNADEMHIPYVYGAIRGWNAQVGFFPSGTAFERINMLYPAASVLTDHSCLSFTPAVCASFQCAEAVKYLLQKGTLLDKQMLYIDLLTNECEEIPFV